MPEQQDISRKKLNEVELQLFEAALRTMADSVNALMRDGVPYGKLVLGGTAPPIMPPQGGV